MAIALRTIGEAARRFLARFCVSTFIGPYVVITTEVRPSAFETTVTWGDGGPQVNHFGADLALSDTAAARNHERICRRVEADTGS